MIAPHYAVTVKDMEALKFYGILSHLGIYATTIVVFGGMIVLYRYII